MHATVGGFSAFRFFIHKGLAKKVFTGIRASKMRNFGIGEIDSKIS